jgi:hypothetical protein
LGFRLWRGLRLQRLPGVKAAGPLEPLLAFGFCRGWLATRLRVRLGWGSHLCQLLVYLPGPLPGPGEVCGLGEGFADALAGMVDLAVGVAGVGEDGGLAVLQVVEAVLNPGDQCARFRFPQVAGRHADVHARGAVERDAHRDFA